MRQRDAGAAICLEDEAAVTTRGFLGPVEQADGLVDGHPPAALFGLAVPLVPRVHVLLGEVAAQEVKVGRVDGDEPRVQHVLHLHTGNKRCQHQKEYLRRHLLSRLRGGETNAPRTQFKAAWA